MIARLHQIKAISTLTRYRRISDNYIVYDCAKCADGGASAHDKGASMTVIVAQGGSLEKSLKRPLRNDRKSLESHGWDL